MARILLNREEPGAAEEFQQIAENYSKEELLFAQQMIRKGRVEGQRYRAVGNACGCFFGVMAVAKLGHPMDEQGRTRQQDLALRYSHEYNASAVEKFFYQIHTGDKPKNSRYALKADRWLTKAIAAKVTNAE